MNARNKVHNCQLSALTAPDFHTLICNYKFFPEFHKIHAITLWITKMETFKCRVNSYWTSPLVNAHTHAHVYAQAHAHAHTHTHTHTHNDPEKCVLNTAKRTRLYTKLLHQCIQHVHALPHENIWLVHIISTIQTTFSLSKVSKTKLQYCFEC